MESWRQPTVSENYKRKLIEVALPLEAINAAGKSEKNRKTGTIRNVHKWFAPMPGPVWRALLAAAVLDDPETDELRLQALSFIEQLVPANGSLPDHDADEIVRNLFKHLGQDVPEVVIVDPFVGGGSTLVEGQRLGFETFGGDLNPVPVLISKTLTELYPAIENLSEPLLATKNPLITSKVENFMADVSLLAEEIQREVEARIGWAYPKINGQIPYAYLWAHTIPCPNPACNVLVPLFATTALSKQKNLSAWLNFEITDSGSCKFYATEIESKSSACTKLSRGQFDCPKCKNMFTVEQLREQSKNMGLLPLAVMARDSESRFFYGSTEQPQAFPSNIPKFEGHETPLPVGGLHFTVKSYGLETYEDMFTDRQLLSVSTFAEVVKEVSRSLPARTGDDQYARLLSAVLGLCVGKLAHSNSKQSTWRLDSRNGSGKVEAAFGQSGLSMVWDFAEVNPFGGSVGDWLQIVETSLRGFVQLSQTNQKGAIGLMPAQSMHYQFQNTKRYLVATDPPYFDAIGYADSSDFFYIWHRDALREVFPDLYQTASAPRAEELISDKSRHGGNLEAAKDFFIDGFRETFSGLAKSVDPEFPIIIVYAHQQKEEKLGEFGSTGWEALLESLMQSNVMVTASWPIHCTSQTRIRAQESNALSAYVALVCRLKPISASATSRKGFIDSLREHLPTALEQMVQGSIAPIDLAQASVGAGMAVFSKYSKVIEVDGSEMTVRTALAEINAVLAEVLSDQVGDFDADTRFCLKWFEVHEWKESEYGQAESLATAMATAVGAIARGGVIKSGGGKVQLIRPENLDADWDPLTDDRISEWEVLMNLIRELDSRGGLLSTAQLLNKAKTRINIESVRDLAYQLYGICERNKWADSARLFNLLGASWHEIYSAALNLKASDMEPNQTLFDFTD